MCDESSSNRGRTVSVGGKEGGGLAGNSEINCVFVHTCTCVHAYIQCQKYI